MLRRHAVHAPVGPVAHVASGDGPELIAEGAVDDEDQLVAEVTMGETLSARLAAVHGEHQRPALRGWVLPQELPLAPGLALFPGKITDRDDARHRLHGRHGRLLLWPSVSRPTVSPMPLFSFHTHEA